MGRISLVTGGTSGIGRAIVMKLLEDSGSKDDLIFVVYGHNKNLAMQMQEELSPENNRKVLFVQADLSEYEGIGKLNKTIREYTDHLDWVVLNTGVGTYQKFDEYTPEIWERVMRTNVSVPVFLIKEIKDIIADHGCIIFMGSHAGQATYSSSLVYSVSKAAVMFAARSMVKLFADRAIRVNTIAPGFIETRWQDNRSKESYERINKKIAMHRFGEPEEVADLCVHILNNEYLNGSVYDIHGGYDYY